MLTKVCITAFAEGIEVITIAYMTTHSNSTSHAWWEEHSDPAETRAALEAYRAEQRDHAAAGWRRIVMLGILAVSVPVLIRLLTTA
ncbi:hypothetical protein J7E62_03915 [Variovorax paradoxus]|nr:hypothetical protein [Variovorax paradoxus]